MPATTETNQMQEFRASVNKRGPYVVFRRGVVFDFPGRGAKVYDLGDYVKLDSGWTDSLGFAHALFGILANSKPGRDDAVAVLASASDYKAVAQEWKEERDRRDKEHKDEVARARPKVKVDGVVNAGLVAENATLRGLLDKVEKRLAALEGAKKKGDKR